MKPVYLLVKIVILFLFLILAVSNTQTVPFFYLPGQEVQWPLIALLFLLFVLGALVGILAMFGRLLRLRSENNRLRAEVKKTARLGAQDLAAPAAKAPASPPAADKV